MIDRELVVVCSDEHLISPDTVLVVSYNNVLTMIYLGEVSCRTGAVVIMRSGISSTTIYLGDGDVTAEWVRLLPQDPVYH